MGELSGMQWFKSSYSGGGGDCVEVAWLGSGRVGVRDSKNPAGPALDFTPADWDAFIGRMRGDRK
ncbi:DUF397 domain-containing protein [Nocardia testacea]|uniref:DUF397 domain-containing protein n=1 Tax=Nocardia testacea TaxID=248551 RepID=UPI0002D53990|nr:DUF397 domain-containing protein [Nocardia testacea]